MTCNCNSPHNNQCCHAHQVQHQNMKLLLFFAAIAIFLEIYHHFTNKEDYLIIEIITMIGIYLYVGHDVLLSALKALFKEHTFDENILMSISTLGAFALGEYPEAIGVMVFFSIGEIIEDKALDKSQENLIKSLDLRSEIIHYIKNENEIIDKQTSEGKINDTILIKVGENVPLDGIVIKGNTTVDTSAITGEAIPRTLKEGDNIVSGWIVLSNPIHVKVTKILRDSMVSKIMDAINNASINKPQIDNFITKFAKIYTPIVLIIAIFTGTIIPLIRHENFTSWIKTALSFLVMSCPCALVISIPLAFYCGIGSASKQKIIIKGGQIIEKLPSIKCILFDKTGTLTKANFAVSDIQIYNNNYNENEILQYAYSAEINSNHPIAKSICNYAKSKNIKNINYESCEELHGRGLIINIKNKKILCGNLLLLDSHNIPLKTQNLSKSKTTVHMAINDEHVADFIISDTVKEDAKETISILKKAKIFTCMLTGDAMEIAKELWNFLMLDECHAELLPSNKLDILNITRKKHGKCMFVGDGINDAPVIAGADIGCAMGSGADIAIENADIVFMNSDTNSIIKSLNVSKSTMIIVWENIILAIGFKLIVIILGLTNIYSSMWLAVFADTGITFICILNSFRLLFKK